MQVDAGLAQLSKYMKLLESQNEQMLESDGKEPDWSQINLLNMQNFAFHPDKADREENTPFSKNAPFFIKKFKMERIYMKKWLTPRQRRWREYEAVQSMGLVIQCVLSELIKC